MLPSTPVKYSLSAREKKKVFMAHLPGKTAKRADAWPPSLLPSKSCAIVPDWRELQSNQTLAAKESGKGNLPTFLCLQYRKAT